MKKQIEEIIQKNFTDPNFNVTVLYEKIGYCESRSFEMIYKYFGMNAQQLIESFRLHQALNMLAEGNLVHKIYGKVGYANVRTFRFAFKKRFKLSCCKCREKLLGCDCSIIELEQFYSTLWMREQNETIKNSE